MVDETLVAGVVVELVVAFRTFAFTPDLLLFRPFFEELFFDLAARLLPVALAVVESVILTLFPLDSDAVVSVENRCASLAGNGAGGCCPTNPFAGSC